MILEFAALVSLRVVWGGGLRTNYCAGSPRNPLGTRSVPFPGQHGRDLLEVDVPWVRSGLRRGGRGETVTYFCLFPSRCGAGWGALVGRYTKFVSDYTFTTYLIMATYTRPRVFFFFFFIYAH